MQCDLPHGARCGEDYLVIPNHCHLVAQAHLIEIEGPLEVAMIQTKIIVGAAAAFALVGALLWGSSALLDPPVAKHHGTVEVTQVDDKAWSVEVKSVDDQRQASLKH
jgi:hypothetical protein